MPVESSSEPEPSPHWEGTAPIPGDAWYMDGSSRGQPAQWRVVAFQTSTEIIWMDNGMEHSSQWAEMQAVWLVVINKPSRGLHRQVGGGLRF